MLASLCHGEPDPALTSDPAYLAILFPSTFGPGGGYYLYLAIPMFGEPDTALTSGPTHPAILILSLFGPGRGC